MLGILYYEHECMSHAQIPSLTCCRFLFVQVLVEKMRVPDKRQQEEISAKRSSNPESTSMGKL